MASRKILVQLDIATASDLTSPLSGFVGFSAKADGLYQKIGTAPELRLLTSADVQNAILADGSITGAVSQAQTFTLGVKLSNLTQGYIPYASGATKLLSDSPIYTDGTNVGIGVTIPAEKLDVNGNIKVNSQVYSSKIIINPTSGVGWYRIANHGSQGGGTVYLDASIDNTAQRLEFTYNIRGWHNSSLMVGSVTVTRSMNYNAGPVNSIRISSDGLGNSYLDLYVSMATSPVPFTVYGTNGASFFASPEYNPVVPTYTKVLDLSVTNYWGIQTTDSINVGENATVSSKVGIGTISPTASLHIKAGTATANTAPIKLTSGVNLTTPESGAIEFSSSRLYFTPSSTRETVAFLSDITVASHAPITLGEIGSAPNSNGITLIGQVLNLEPASALYGGVLTNSTQTIAGAKTLSSLFTASAGIANNGSYTQTGTSENTFTGIMNINNVVSYNYRSFTTGGSSNGVTPRWSKLVTFQTTTKYNHDKYEILLRSRYYAGKLYVAINSDSAVTTNLVDFRFISDFVGSTPDIRIYRSQDSTYLSTWDVYIYNDYYTSYEYAENNTRSANSGGIGKVVTFYQNTYENPPVGSIAVSYGPYFNGIVSSIGITSSGTINFSSLTASKVVFTDSSKNLTSTGIGTAAQFIKGDGSLDSNTYLTTGTTIISGSGVAERITFWNGTNSLSSSPNLMWFNDYNTLSTYSINLAYGFKLGSSTTAGYVLTADANGNGTWKAPTGSIIGSGVSDRVTFWNGTNSLSSSNDLWWNDMGKILNVTGDIVVSNSINAASALVGSVSTELVSTNGFRLLTSITAGYVLTTDAYGNGTWQAPTGGGSYTLPTATASLLGGVKIGSGITISSGVISVSTNYQAPITTGTTAQYLRGDLSLATFPTIHTGNGFNGGVTFWNGTNSLFAATELTWNNTSKNLSVTGGVSANDFSSNSMLTNTLFTQTFKLGSNVTAGYVLTTDANGNGTWQAPTGSGGGSYVPYTGADRDVNLASYSIYAYDFLIYSDINLKCNIEDIKMKKLDINYKQFEYKTSRGEKRYGVIAQELLTIAPEFVSESNNSYAVKYTDLLIYEIAQLKEEVKQLKSLLCR